MHTRRKFLCDLSLAATAALVPAASMAHQPIPTMPVETLGLKHFRRQLNTRFNLQTRFGATDLTLVEASESPIWSEDSEIDGNESFSLLFHGPERSPLPQDTYEMSHPVFGRLAMFIVPVGPALTSHCTYEAVFNRPTDSTELARQLARAPRRAQKFQPKFQPQNPRA